MGLILLVLEDGPLSSFRAGMVTLSLCFLLTALLKMTGILAQSGINSTDTFKQLKIFSVPIHVFSFTGI